MAAQRQHGEPQIPKLKKSRYKTWGEVFRNSVRRGDDHGYAAYLADNWERRKLKATRG